VYDKPTILWLAPTCPEALPQDGTTPYRGGQVRVAVRATAGKQRLGKGAATIDYGRTAVVSLTLNGKQRRAGGVPAGILGEFSATTDSRGVAPPIATYSFDNGDGDSTTIATSDVQAQAALVYRTPGKHVASVTVGLSDGSALCDNVLANVRTSVNSLQLRVTRTPTRAAYRPGDPATGTVHLLVHVKNVSDPAAGGRGSVLFLGKILSCDTEVRAGESTLEKTTEIDFQHCSSTVGQACASDQDCAPGACPNCDAGETCLTSSHCALRIGVGCVRD